MLQVDEVRMRNATGICTALLAIVLGCSSEASLRQASETAEVKVATIELKIVAHQDDDLLFMNPDLAESIGAGRTVRTVFVTAGDAGRGAEHWTRREEGILEAYATMASADNSWDASTLLVGGRQVQLRSLSKLPRVSVVFLRLPDGNGHGGGFPATHKESLAFLWSGKIPALHPVDGSASYSKPELIGVLTGLMAGLKAQTIDTQDWTGRFKGDHSDHFSAATFAHAAEQAYEGAHKTRVYRGYNVMREPVNLLSGQQAAKQTFFLSYAKHDGQLCPPGTGACKARSDYPRYLGRQYPFIPGNLVGPGGKCLQVVSEKMGQGRVAMRACRDIPEQKWSMKRKELQSLKGGCLATEEALGASPAALLLGPCGADDRTWSMSANGHLKSDEDLCATLSAGGPDHDPQLVANSCGDVPEQKWRLYDR